MDSAGSRLTSGHAGSNQAAGYAGGVNRMVIASYTKFKGLPGVQGQPDGAEQGMKPVPVPPALLVGANLDVRV